jgi:Asp-tRNA(Asn)/Glu-tRNA(Gln) amidotransferase C subunit
MIRKTRTAKTAPVRLTNDEIDLIEHLLWNQRLEYSKRENWELVDEMTETIEKFEELDAEDYEQV